MAKVDPFIQPIPDQFSRDPVLRPYYEYLHRFLHDIWYRTGGSEDFIENAETQEKYPWDLTGNKPEESVTSPVSFPVQVQSDTYRAVSVNADYTALDFDFVSAKGGSTITLPEYPKDGSVVIIRNSDGSNIGLNGNGRLINGERTGKIRRKGTAITFQYFIDENEWYAR
jgi:hypothetical protein